jgi:hypothetical protein
MSTNTPNSAAPAKSKEGKAQRKLEKSKSETMTRQEVLAALAAGDIDEDEADEKLSALESKKRSELYCKVSANKGALSVYGLQRMPVTLYVEQWERLLDFADEIRDFAKANNSTLSRKEKNGKK